MNRWTQAFAPWGMTVDARGWILKKGWGARIRTWECRFQRPVPYRLATPHLLGAYREGVPLSILPRIRAVLLCLSLLLSLGPGISLVQAGGGTITSLRMVRPLADTDSPLLDQAQRIALSVLATDFTGDVHVAARNYYNRPWLRDSYAWGTIPSVMGASLAAYTSSELSYWLERQQSFGGWLTAPLSGYFDETAILIAAVFDVYTITGNKAVAVASLPRLERGWHWLAQSYVRQVKGSSYLLYANVPPHTAADWVDQVARHGYTTQLEALWYRATQSLAALWRLAGNTARAAYYAAYAGGIKRDINRLLWTQQAPVAIDAPAVPGFGHYRSWAGGRDYFELDSNYLCIVYGIATPAQALSINHFVLDHAGYLLGWSSPGGVPARVVYGDYSVRDYAARHARQGPDMYQSAYWPSVGALVAMGMTLIGDVMHARQVMLRLAAAFVRDHDIREWYASHGSGFGAPSFGWAARMFLLAVDVSYLGIVSADPSGTARAGGALRLVRPAGTGSTDFSYHGHTVLLTIQGSGSRPQVRTLNARLHGSLIPASLLCAGCVVDATWAN